MSESTQDTSGAASLTKCTKARARFVRSRATAGVVSAVMVGPPYKLKYLVLVVLFSKKPETSSSPTLVEFVESRQMGLLQRLLRQGLTALPKLLAELWTRLILPFSMAFDAADNLYFTEPVFSRVRVLRPDGVIRTIAGTGAGGVFPGDLPGPPGDEGPAIAAVAGCRWHGSVAVRHRVGPAFVSPDR